MAVKRWSGTAWEVYAGADVVPVKVTDGRPGKTTFIGATTPTGQVDGDIWIDQDTVTNAVVPTALTTKGDTFVATGNAAYTRLAAGSNGESLYADSSTSTGLRWQGDYNVGKNKILNGATDIWQRGTSFSITGPGTVIYSADRWICYSGNAGTISRDTSLVPVGFESSLKFTSTINSSGIDLYQLIETKNVIPLRGKTVTLSAYVAGTDGKTLPGMTAYYSNTTDDMIYLTSGVIIQTVAVSSALSSTSFQRVSMTFTVPSTARTIRIGLISSTLNNTEFINWTGIQLEVGSVATPFTTNTANPQAELAACQRYFQIMSGPGSGVIGSKNNGTTTYFIVPLKVNMRAAPTLSSSAVGDLALSALNGSTTYPATSFSSNRSSPWSASFGLTQATSDGAAGAAGILLIDSNNGWVAFTAEL